MLNVKGESVEQIIREVADEIIVPRFGKLLSCDVTHKKDDSPVTIADQEAEIELSKRLSGLLVGSKVVGEEAFSANPTLFGLFQEENPVWIIDPIDGTYNFVHGNPNFGVIVALAQRDQLLGGWIYHPVSGEFVSAEKGAGVWHKGEKLKSLPPAPLNQMRGLSASDTDGVWETFLRCGKNLDYAGPELLFTTMASSNDFPLVVAHGPCFGKKAGQVHFFTSGNWCTPWDDAAGVLICQEAGGYVRHADEKPFQLSAFPERMGKTIICAPDADSWLEIRDWLVKNGEKQ